MPVGQPQVVDGVPLRRVREGDLVGAQLDHARNAQVDHDTVMLLGEEQRVDPGVADREGRVLEGRLTQDQPLVRRERSRRIATSDEP